MQLPPSPSHIAARRVLFDRARARRSWSVPVHPESSIRVIGKNGATSW